MGTFLRHSVVQCSGHPDTKACLPTASHIFPVPPGRQMGYRCAD